MRRFLQWSLVTVVALILIAVIVGQMLAISTGRAKDASVAVLKEKLVRLEAERCDAGPVTIPDAGAVSAGVDLVVPQAPIDKDALRARWLVTFDKLAKTWRDCGSPPPESWRAATDLLLDNNDAELDAGRRAELAAYLSCLAPAKASLLRLLGESGDIGDLFEPSTLWQDSDYPYGVWYCERFLKMHIWLEGSLRDHAAAIDTLDALVRLTGINVRTMHRTALEPYSCWGVVKRAIESGAIDDARWDRLLDLLDAHRKHDFFFAQVLVETNEIVNRFENWKTVPRDLQFTAHPVSYLRTWAYPRLTPALFNHDFDQFNRAIDRLLDMADKPYFEVRDDLDQFCKDFDVEPSNRDIKFTRGNPGWRYVLSLSRYEIEQNARNQASIDVIRFALLLEKYKRANGNYPESLEVFSETLGGSIPVNPLQGDAYVYEQTEDSFRLGYHDDEDPDLVAELGLDPVKVVLWHDPLGYGPEWGVE